MQVYQVAQGITAFVCAMVFALAARRVRDRVARYCMVVWALAMVWAGVAAPLIAFTHLDATVVSISRIISPIGWTALTVLSVRMMTRGN